jgi:hypothetical protein
VTLYRIIAELHFQKGTSVCSHQETTFRRAPSIEG